MAQPPINGILASSSGVAAMRASGSASLPSLAGMGLSAAIPSGLGLGLLLAIALLAYWYRRVL